MLAIMTFLAGCIIGVTALVVWTARAKKPAWDKHCALAIYCALVRRDGDGADAGVAYALADEFTEFGIDLKKGGG